MNDLLRRLAGARVMREKGRLTLVHDDGSASRLEGDSAALCEAVLELFDAPRSRDDVVEHVRGLAEGPFDERVVDDLLALLSRAGVLSPVPAAPSVTTGTLAAAQATGILVAAETIGTLAAGQTTGTLAAAQTTGTLVAPRRTRVVLGVTGAIQAVEVPRLVGLLQLRGFEVRVAATKAARRFVSFDALTALTHRAVATGLWGGADRPAAHVDLAGWADVVVCYPASGTTLSRLARGDFSDVVSATALATRAPVLLVPSMNEGMLRAPAVERNLATLREDGFFVAEPSWGVEVAEPPGARDLHRGAALAPERVVDLIAIVAAQSARAAAGVDRERAYEVDWERAYEDETATLPWAATGLDSDLADELAALPPPRSLIDIGTGLGTAAIHAAGRGYRVVATDLSGTALRRAHRLAGDLPITFVRDDITDTRLVGSFDVAVDRGTMHTLAEPQISAYAAAVAMLVRPGGTLLLVSDDKAAGARRTLRLSPAEIAERLPGFALRKAASTTLVASEPGAAWLTVWCRSSAS